MATLVFCLLTQGWVFDLEFYLSSVVRFNAAGPFYYVLMYLQFLFAVPILALFTRWSGWRGIGLEIVGFMVCLVIGCFTTTHSNVLHVYGGGGNLLGGTFLILLYMGIWFGKYCRDIRLGKLLLFVEFLVFCVAAVAWWGFMVQDRLRMDVLFPFVKSLKFRGNPPGICVVIYSCLVAGTVFFLGTLLDYCATNRVRRIMGGVTWLGRHTLYIFLYHNFWRDVLQRIPCISGMGYTWLKWIIYFSVMILGSLLFEVVFKWLYHIVVMAYRTR